MIDDSDDFSKLIMKDGKDGGSPMNSIPPSVGEIGMEDKPDVDVNMDKMDKMADRKMENEAVEKEPEVGRKNKSERLGLD